MLRFDEVQEVDPIEISLTDDPKNRRKFLMMQDGNMQIRKEKQGYAIYRNGAIIGTAASEDAANHMLQNWKQGENIVREQVIKPASIRAGSKPSVTVSSGNSSKRQNPPVPRQVTKQNVIKDASRLKTVPDGVVRNSDGSISFYSKGKLFVKADSVAEAQEFVNALTEAQGLQQLGFFERLIKEYRPTGFDMQAVPETETVEAKRNRLLSSGGPMRRRYNRQASFPMVETSQAALVRKLSSGGPLRKR